MSNKVTKKKVAKLYTKGELDAMYFKGDAEGYARRFKEEWDEVGVIRSPLDQVGVDNDPGIDVPLHARGGQWKWNYENKMPLHDKITWVLTAVNVAILITLAGEILMKIVGVNSLMMLYQKSRN